MADTMVYPTGCSATGGTGNALVYGLPSNNVSAGWQSISTTQTPAWQNIGNTQTPVWTPVTT